MAKTQRNHWTKWVVKTPNCLIFERVIRTKLMIGRIVAGNFSKRLTFDVELQVLQLILWGGYDE